MEENKEITSKEYVFGIRPLDEAIAAGVKFEKAFVLKGMRNREADPVVEKLRSSGVPVSYVPKVKLEKLCKGGNHQGVVALKAVVIYQELDAVISKIKESGKPGLLVALDRISDVRNLGAIARSAHCFGADAMIIPQQDAAQINAEAVKSSAGALASLPVVRVNSLISTMENLQTMSFQVVAATEKAEDTLESIDLYTSTVLVLGNEHKGVDKKILSTADAQFKIEMNSQFDSLNVSVAAGIALHEIAKQRRS